MKSFVVSLLLALAGCVSIPTHQKGVRNAYIDGLKRAQSIALSQDCLDAAHLIGGRIEVEKMKN